MKKILLLCCFAFLYFLISAQTCNNLFPLVSPDGQHLYFSSNRNGSNYEIYSSDLDGISNLVRLTNTTVNNLYPSVSADGSKIVFQSGDYGASAEIFMMNSDGTGLIQLTNNSVYEGYPNFSPDGQKIVFDGWDSNPYPEIFTMNVDGTNIVQLTSVSGAYWQCSPMFNPSGTYIYFSLGYNADNHLARMNLDGSNIIDITQPNSFGSMEFGMHFSPDASKIVFSTTDWAGYNNGADIVIADTNGTNWSRITTSTNGEWYHSPVWHKTNNKFYYSYYSSTTPYWQIYEMLTDGTAPALVSVCSNVGLSELHSQGDGIKVFPIPAGNELNLSMSLGMHSEFYDVSGRRVLSSTSNKTDISALVKGFYLIHFLDSENNLVQISKIIKL